MGFVKCKFCGKEISDTAVVCPACGQPVQNAGQDNLAAGASGMLLNQNLRQSKNAGKISALSIWALVLNALFVPFLVGMVLAIVDLAKKDGRKKVLSIIALVMSGIWILVFYAVSPHDRTGAESASEITRVETSLVEVTEEDSDGDKTDIASSKADDINEGDENIITDSSVADDDISEENDSKETLRTEIKVRENLVWFGEVRNDATGKWRLSEYSSVDSQETFAIDYYNAFFESDDEIHAVINMEKGITARVSCIMGDALEVALFDYVEEEEFDAKKLFGGNLLKKYFVTISTGEIEDVSDPMLEPVPDLSSESTPKPTSETTPVSVAELTLVPTPDDVPVPAPDVASVLTSPPAPEPEPVPDTVSVPAPEPIQQAVDGAYVVNGKNKKIHKGLKNGGCSATKPGSKNFMEYQIPFDSLEEAEAYTGESDLCGNCWKN